MAFTINSTAAPDYAQPSGKRTRLLRPRNTDLDGLGRPCGAVGKPEAVIGKRIINESGFQWYLSFFADPLDQSVDLTEISLHALRHGWATVALEAGVPMKVVQDRLNHASERITADIYTHVRAPLQSDAAERVASLILPANRPDR